MLAKQHHANPDRLGRIVRGDLDWIVMKAMEKARKWRFEISLLNRFSELRSGRLRAALRMIPSRCVPRRWSRLALDAYALSARMRCPFAPSIICPN